MEPRHIQFIAPPAHLQAIGLVAACSSKVEWLVEETIWQLANIEDSLDAHILTAELSLRARFDALLALAELKIRNSPQEERLQIIQKRMVSGYKGQPSLSSERNKIIHAYWSAGDEPTAFASNIKARGKLNFDIRAMSEPEIRRIAEKLFSVAIEIDEIQRELTDLGFHQPGTA